MSQDYTKATIGYIYPYRSSGIKKDRPKNGLFYERMGKGLTHD
jgi:hypothetical protein